MQLHHHVLRGHPPVETRREAMLLLALCYNHLPIDSLDVYRSRYLEEVILEFPGSTEAKKAFAVYKEYKMLIHGVADDAADLPASERERLESLRQVATKGV